MNRINRDNSAKIEMMRNAVRACAIRHSYHMMPPQGWMNDPNGFVFWNGQYHLFYQHYPYAPRWGLMHWGHCVSDDLIRWRYLPIALTPDRPYDANGCYSGSSIVHEGKLYVFYTGIAANGQQTQCMAISEDGIRFRKHKNNPVIASPPDSVRPHQFRDPYVFRRGGRFFMVVGAESKEHRGQAVVYGSYNLLDWTHLHTITAANASMGYMWECPNLFFIGDQAILMLSPQGIANHPPFDSDHDAGYFVGRFDPDTGAYEHGTFHKLDHGFDFYAPQVTADDTDRRIMTAWMSTWATPTPTEACQWAGSEILPRETRLQNGLLAFQPVREIERYLSLVTSKTDVSCGTLLPLRGTACRLAVVSDPQDFSIYLFCSPDGREYTALSYDTRTRSFRLDLSRSGNAARAARGITLERAPDTLDLDIYLDRSSIEVFLCGGSHVMTTRVFPHRGSDGIRFSGKAMFRRVSLWEIEQNPKNG